MGEIADALRRARLQREARGAASEGTVHAPEGHESPLQEVDDGASEPECHSIPRDKEELWVPRAVLVDAQQPVAQRFRHLAVRVRRELQRRNPPILLVTSAGGGEGKTTTACNLALALTSITPHHRTALVELDLRRPSLARALEIANPPGLERVLEGRITLKEACVPTEFPGLDLYPAREANSRAHELISGSRARSLFRELTRHYAMVVCDTPPVLPVPDVALVVEYAGAWLTVARSGVTRRAAFREVMETLPRDKLIGAFLNDARMPRNVSHYYRYYDEEDEAK